MNKNQKAANENLILEINSLKLQKLEIKYFDIEINNLKQTISNLSLGKPVEMIRPPSPKGVLVS